MNRPDQKFYKVLAESALRAGLDYVNQNLDKWKELQTKFQPN